MAKKKALKNVDVKSVECRLMTAEQVASLREAARKEDEKSSQERLDRRKWSDSIYIRRLTRSGSVSSFQNATA